MTRSSESPVRFETHGAVAILTIDRPEQSNAIDSVTNNELNRLMADFEAREDLAVGVLTGAGSKAFCAGADLDLLAAGGAEAMNRAEPYGFGGLGAGIRRKPMIAAVNGAAVGGGFELALLCDLVVASETARFCLPELSLGAVPTYAIARLPALIGPTRATELVLTGRWLGAREAREWGVVTEIVKPDRVTDRALVLGSAIASRPRLATEQAIRLLQPPVDQQI
jgi:enoyl-CoA hydratase/carnithine racemase